MERMLLLLSRSPEQEAALRQLLEEQQDSSSANYRQWLTPEQFGDQFGAAPEDIDTITSWLSSQGFRVDRFRMAARYRVLRHRRRGRARVAHSDSQLSGTRQATLANSQERGFPPLSHRPWLESCRSTIHFERHAARLRYGGERSRQRPVDAASPSRGTRRGRMTRRTM